MAGYGRGRTLGSSVVDGLSTRGERPALVAPGEEGVKTWTYGELADRVWRLACGLRGAGVDRGDHVALFAANSKEWVVACLAVISAGAVVVPVDAQPGDEALGRVPGDSGARHLFTTADQEGRLANVDTEAGLKAILLNVGEDDGRSWQCLLTDEDVDLPPVEPDDVASLFAAAAPLSDKGAHCGSLAFAQRRHTVVHGLDDLLLRPGAPVIVVGGQRFAEGHRDLLQPS